MLDASESSYSSSRDKTAIKEEESDATRDIGVGFELLAVTKRGFTRERERKREATSV